MHDRSDNCHNQFLGDVYARLRDTPCTEARSARLTAHGRTAPEAEAWQRRIARWARFIAVDGEAVPSE